MGLEIKQESRYVEDDWWEWAVWLTGPDAELSAIEYVIWHLHPTFPNPKVKVKNGSNGFRLGGSGWGEFRILAECHPADGSDTVLLKHDLELEYPSDDDADTGNAAPQVPTVFLSSSVSDAPLANALRDALRQHDIIVVGPDELDPGLPLDAALEASLKGSDATVALFSESTGSSWIRNEVGTAHKLGVPILPVISGSISDIPKSLAGLRSVRLEGSADIGRVAGELAGMLHQPPRPRGRG